MSKLTLYGFDQSAPVRACLLTLKALELPYKYKLVNLMTKENHSAEYLAKNPQHTVPTLKDDGNFIWDSHAICAYLVRKYGKDDTLYPKDYLARAVVDQRLHFESSVLFYGGIRNITAPMFIFNDMNVPQHKIDALAEAYDFLEIFLCDRNYVAGDKMTIADFSIISTVSTTEAFLPIDAIKYDKLSAWIRRMEKLPYYEEANGKSAKKTVETLNSLNYKIVP